MNKDLTVAPQRSSSELTRPRNADPGVGVSLTEVTFSERGYSYEQDIPKAFRTGAALVPVGSTVLAVRDKGNEGARVPVRSEGEQEHIEQQAIASGARQQVGVRRIGGRTVLRRVGWQATPALIMVTTAEQALRKEDDGKYHVAGEWLIEHRRTFRDAAGRAVKRVGTVKDDQPSRNERPSARSAAAPASGSTPDAHTLELSLLPAQVRSFVIATIPNPTFTDGTAHQHYDDNGNPERIEVNVLRMNAKFAVVVRASKKINSSEWEVSQAFYTLTDPEVEQA